MRATAFLADGRAVPSQITVQCMERSFKHLWVEWEHNRADYLRELDIRIFLNATAPRSTVAIDTSVHFTGVEGLPKSDYSDQVGLRI